MKTNCLQLVDLITPKGKQLPGLVPVDKKGHQTRNLAEKVAINNAATFGLIDYVFFRRFNDKRSSHIAAYVVDNSDEQHDESQLSKLHWQVWLYGVAPLLYISWPSRIDILTCARGADFWTGSRFKYNPVRKFDSTILETVSEINVELKRFSAYRLRDGTFWEDPDNAKLVNHTKAAHHSLIQAIVEADNDLDGGKNPILRRLLLLTVLIKYLEDRKVFPNAGWFGKFHKGARTFFEVLQSHEPDKVYCLLNNLERKFNGDVFTLPRQPKQKLTRKNLRTFAELVEAKTIRRQIYLWQQYSFEYLPVEIISHIYQRFVQRGHGAIYTPKFLTTLLLNHAMPYSQISDRERVLDPACGSGIFLVGAFKRLINTWRDRHGWKKLSVYTLKNILKRSIYGIELDPLAIELTAFSLSLAICDALKPDVIWHELKFDRLKNTNLFEGDFFRLLLDSQETKHHPLNKGFDIIIGNPPFESKLTTAAKEICYNRDPNKFNKTDIPDKQIAYLFLREAFRVLSDKGNVCLIQPAGLLYNRRAHAFRKQLFKNQQINTVLDFTSIRNLYESNSQTVAIFSCNSTPSNKHKIAHWTFRRTASVRGRICFELDHYDHHRITQHQAETDPYIWRINLLGGSRLAALSQRLRSMRTLSKFVTEKGWSYGEGFNRGAKEKKKSVSFLQGKPLLPTKALTDSGLDETQITSISNILFEYPGKFERFTPPLILIKKLGSLPIVYWNKSFLAYNHRIVGLHAPSSEVMELRYFYNAFRRKHAFYQFCCMLHGSESLVGRATSILKKDIDSLPYPKETEGLELSFWEEVLYEDLIYYLGEYVLKGQSSRLLKTKVNNTDLQKYSKMFIQMLGSIYAKLHASTPISLNGFVCQPFYFGQKPNLSWIIDGNTEDLWDIICETTNNEYIRTFRVLRFYTENVLLIIKPNRLRYWIRSTAIRDADETLLDLRKQGY